MAKNTGIFIQTVSTDAGQIIKGCSELLKANNYNDVFIKCLQHAQNERLNYAGYKVHFSDDGVVDCFLNQKYLLLSNGKASIHPLTTRLILVDAIPDSADNFKESLQTALEMLEFKPVLNICSIPYSPEFPDIQSGNWLIELDIPEIEELPIFKKNGLPEMMILPSHLIANSELRGKIIVIKCLFCNKAGHFRHNCSLLDNTIFPQNSSKSENPFIPIINIEENFSNPRTQINKFEIRDRDPKTNSISKTTKKNRIDTIASDLEKKITQKGNSKTEMEGIQIKQESKETKRKNSSKRSLGESDRYLKKFCFATLLEDTQDNNERFETNIAATSTTGKGGFATNYQSSVPAFSTNVNFRGTDYHTERDNYLGFHNDNNLPSPNVPTSSQPETNYRKPYEDSFNRDGSDVSDSNESSGQPNRATRKKPTYVPVVLPERIRDIVLSKPLEEGELDVEQLEAFFNHVKKKMSPAKIARQFTSDVHCLQLQLRSIVRQYYMTPKAGSGDDSRFMKWLEGMLERFDSTPAKRKKPKSETFD